MVPVPASCICLMDPRGYHIRTVFLLFCLIITVLYEFVQLESLSDDSRLYDDVCFPFY